MRDAVVRTTSGPQDAFRPCGRSRTMSDRVRGGWIEGCCMQVDWLVMIGSGPLAVMLLGIAIVAMGLRGRRIDEHPLCRC